tara:strand:+ start:575 stop:1639 length:1065 start_codon:yes stop_codon:yes gene_type:complete
MLEQAVVDAQELKEAAIKNAEQEVLEKYSGEIKEAVNMLIEQSLEDPAAVEDPSSLGFESPSDMSSVGPEGNHDAIIANIPLKATEKETGGATGDTIILDLDALMEAVKSSTDSADEMVFEMNESDFENLLQKESDNEEMVEETKVTEEEIELDEVTLNDAIEEILKVDLEVVPRGMMGTTHPTTIEQIDAINIAAAAEEDTVKKEENEAFNNAVKKIANLEEQVKSLKSDKNRLAKDHNELKSIARQVSNKLTELNTANAKLVYQNRILESSSLNERQKEKLVEAVSNAKSNKEAKVIYETLQESLASKAQSAPQNLSEAVSKNNRLILQSNKNPEQVSNAASERMKKLAGII